MKKGNLAAAAFFAALAIFVFWEIRGFPGGRKGVPGPAVFPEIIAVLMLMACISLVITTVRMTPEEDRPLRLLSNDSMRVYLSMVILVAYIILIPILGFCISSTLMLFGFIMWFGRYSFPVCLVTSGAITGIIFFVFSEILNVPFRFGMFGVP